MRRYLLVAALTLVALPLFAQNTDIESLSGLQFNFGNPGARSLGMGGAFLGLADDASAAEANPAGLTILRKPEVSVEARNYLEQQLFSTSGTYPNVERTAFTHYSDRVNLTFGSAVIPFKNKFTIGLYYHEPLRNAGAGEVIPTRNNITGAVEKQTPNFYLPAAGGEPISAIQCQQLRDSTKNPAACFEYRIDPFISALDVRQRTFGLAAAWQIVPALSIGATARYQRFREGAFTFRFSQDFQPTTISVQATATDKNGQIEVKDSTDVTFTAGFKFTPSDKFSIGGVYKKGPQFDTPTYLAGQSNNFEFEKLADTTFHMPDTAGLGISIRPRPELTLNADAVYVKYKNLVDNFVATIADVQNINSPFDVNNVTEVHVGGEYFFTTKVPFALRAGYWRDPAHAIEWRGPVNRPDFVAESLLYPKGQTQNHYAVGGGFAWPRFQVDFAYDTSKTYKVGSVSMVTRF